MEKVATGGLVEAVERFRLEAGQTSTDAHKARAGQFFTPAAVARLMASMFEWDREVRLLDAGAGVGSLFAACVESLCTAKKRPAEIAITAFENDRTLHSYLRQTANHCEAICKQAGIRFSFILEGGDFLDYAS